MPDPITPDPTPQTPEERRKFWEEFRAKYVDRKALKVGLGDMRVSLMHDTHGEDRAEQP